MAALSTTATVAIVASAAVAAAGSIATGIANKNAADFQSEVQRQQAERERQIAAGRERDFRRQQSALLARRRAGMGASGVEAAAGSPLLATEDFAREVELQAQRIRSGGETAATRLQQQAQLTGMAGRSAQTAGFLRAGSSLLRGFGTAFE